VILEAMDFAEKARVGLLPYTTLEVMALFTVVVA